ncbi:hypothetical protein FJZ55_10205, partial [Candidatus Woesearchaeota archaeon]|nr:hypothetical protein [Candidatus Woesearchaeota archaeon]
NVIPEIDDMDQAISDRLRCISFPTKFVDNPKLENEKKRDNTLEQKLIHWRNDFMLLLIEYYYKYMKTGLTPTKSIMEWTNMYQEEEDIYLAYVNQRLEKSDTHIRINDVYDDYVSWCSSNNQKSISQNLFTRNIKNYVDYTTVSINGKTYKGIRSCKLKDDVNSDND